MVHELGHAFNSVIAANSDAKPYDELGQALGKDKALGVREDLRKGMYPYPWQQNTRAEMNANNELFADSFLNWTYDSFMTTTIGNDTVDWFNAQMELWVSGL